MKLTILRWLLIAFFILLIIIEICYAENRTYHYLNDRRIGLLLLLISVFLIQNRFTWLLLLAISGYGVYSFFTYASIASSYTTMEFTARLATVCFGESRQSLAGRFCNMASLLFYISALILFFIPNIRKQYNMVWRNNSKNAPNFK